MAKYPKYQAISLLIAVAMLPACSQKQQAATKPSTDAIRVQVINVQASSSQRILDLTGTVGHRRETPLGFTTAGKVASVRYDVGDYVRRGALIAALDTTVVGADMDVARAEQKRADAELARIAALYRQGWVTKGRYESADAAASEAAARVAQAGFARRTSQLYAPSSGVILSRQMQPGQVVAAGSAAVVLGQDDEGFVLRVPVVAADAAKLRIGMPGSILINSAEATEITAPISEIDGRANAGTGAFTVQFRLPRIAGIRSGQIGSAKIALPAAADGSLQIPASAIFGIRTGEGLVYVVDPKSNKAMLRNVAIGELTDKFISVTGGISPGDMLVISGAEKLRNGSAIIPLRVAQ